MNTITTIDATGFQPWPLDLQGWGGNHPIFSDLINKIKPNLIIEVGTWKGQSAINMARNLKKTNPQGKIYCVDTWLGAVEFWDTLNNAERSLNQKFGYPQIYYQFLSNCIHENVLDVIIPFPTTSSIASKYFKAKQIKADMVYVDASHDEVDVLQDIQNYLPLVNHGGVLFGDDYCTFTGVREAVNKSGNKFEVIDERYWVIKV